MKFNEFAWDGLTRLLKRALTWTGKQTFSADIDITDQINLTDGTDTHIIKAVQETGLGGRLTIGLDETARTLVICDAGDIDTDLGLAVATHSALYLFDEDVSHYLKLSQEASVSAFRNSGGNADIYFYPQRRILFENPDWIRFKLLTDLAADSYFNIISDTNIELTDADGEQSFVYIEPKINQSGTGAYNAIKVDVTETQLGDGTTGDGNLLLNLQVASVTKAKIDNTGRLVLAESTTPAALADHAFLYAKDATGGNMFVADAAADETQISSHNFSMFTPDPNEQFPWSFYAENAALGVKVNVDMAGAIRAIENLTGKTFIHSGSVPITQDLKVQYREQWKQKYIKENTVNVEVAQVEAIEMVEVDERTLYDVEIVDPKTGEIKIVKQGIKIGENITGYEFVDGKVKPIIEIIWETHKVEKPEVKEDHKFNEANGKFYKVVKPAALEAETAAITGFVFTPPEWMVDKLGAVVVKK